MTGEPIATAKRSFAFSPERVFDAWLDLDAIKMWMLSLGDRWVGGHLNAHVGGRYAFRTKRGDDTIEQVGTYTAIERPHRLDFTFGIAGENGADPVTVRIEPEGSGSRLRVAHRLSLEWADYEERSAHAWATMLANLDALLQDERQ